VTTYTNGTGGQVAPAFYSGPTTNDRDMTTVRRNWGVAPATGIGGVIQGIGDFFSFSGKTDNGQICGAMSIAYSSKAADPYLASRKKIADQHIKSLDDMAANFQPLANAYIAALDSVNQSDLPTATRAMQNAIVEGGLKYIQAIATVAEVEFQKVNVDSAARTQTMTENGFVAAGMFYIDLTRVHTAVRSAINTPASYIMPDVATLAAGMNADSYKNAMKNFDDANGIALEAAGANEATSASTSGATTVNSGLNGMLPTISESMSAWDIAGTINQLSTTLSARGIRLLFGVGTASAPGATPSTWQWWRANDSSPWTSNSHSAVLQLKNKGDNILDMAATALIVITVARSLNGGINDAVTGEKNVLEKGIALATGIVKTFFISIAPYILAALFSLITFGLMLAVYVPMVPYMLWTGAVVGLLVLIAEALVASSLWAVMIMHPSGEGVTSDQSRNGIMLLLGLFTRPALMLMGMVSGMFMLEPLVMLINDSFYYVMDSVQASSMTGLFSFIGFAALYCSMILSVVNKCFALIHIMPDKVLRWFGGGAEQMGEGKVRDDAYSLISRAGAITGKGIGDRIAMPSGREGA
jgi:conjugal transfer/type IV secretion protein DotA/TraY